VTLHRVLWLGLLGVCLTTSIATAQTFKIQAFAFGGSPPLHADAGYVDVRNNGSYYCRVEVQRTVRNPESHYYDCSGCVAACEGASLYGVCSFTKTDILEVAPGSCTSTVALSDHFDCLPNGTGGNDWCDNHGGNAQHVNYDRNNDSIPDPTFCSYYSRVIVRVIEFRAPQDTVWTLTNTPVCKLGLAPEDDEMPGAPTCGNSTYCTNNNQVRPACQ
jgi:hypothetical protein